MSEIIYYSLFNYMCQKKYLSATRVKTELYMVAVCNGYSKLQPIRPYNHLEE